MDATATDNLDVSDATVRGLIWKHCAWMVIATLALGMVVGIWWPLWLMPPYLTDTVSVYLAFSQLWVVALVICLLLRPSGPGRRSMLNAVAVAWPFTALLAFVFTGGALTSLFRTFFGPNPAWQIVDGIDLVVWIIYIMVPIYLFKRWLSASDEKLPVPVRFLLLGVVVAVIYGIAIVGNVGLVDGGILTEPLRCDAPTVASGEVTYLCHQSGMSDYAEDFELSGTEGSPVGKLRSVIR